MAYTSQTLIENYLQTTISSSLSSYLTTVIAAVKLWIDNYTGTTFEAVSETRYYDGNGLGTILIDDFTTLTSISLLNADGSVDSLLAATDYILYPLNGVVRNTIYLTYSAPYTRFSNYHNRIKVVAIFGHNVTVPADVQLAATMLAADLYNAGSQDGVVTSESLGDYSISFATAEESAKRIGATSILDQYRTILI